MLSLSVNRWGFTDKLFKINNLSVRRRVFTDKIHSVRQRLSGISWSASCKHLVIINIAIFRVAKTTTLKMAILLSTNALRAAPSGYQRPLEAEGYLYLRLSRKMGNRGRTSRMCFREIDPGQQEFHS